MRQPKKTQRRRASVLVEYALLISGVALAGVVAISLLGKKTADAIGVMAAILPGAQPGDNKPIASTSLIPLDETGGSIHLNNALLVSSGGIDRLEKLLGAGGGALLIEP